MTLGSFLHLYFVSLEKSPRLLIQVVITEKHKGTRNRGPERAARLRTLLFAPGHSGPAGQCV